MRDFKGFVSNGKFSVGCTGQTVYVYDDAKKEIAKFKDMKYAYTPMISPNGDIFIVKSTEGNLAVYSFHELKFIKKFRFSKDAGQDGGFCFSGDGLYFYNIENNCMKSIVSVYETQTFSKVQEISVNDDMMFCFVEFDKHHNCLFLLGYCRGKNGYQGGFVADIKNNSIDKIVKITELEYDFYMGYKNCDLHGLAEKEYAGSHFWGMDMKVYKIPEEKLSLSKLFYSHENDVI